MKTVKNEREEREEERRKLKREKEWVILFSEKGVVIKRLRREDVREGETRSEHGTQT